MRSHKWSTFFYIAFGIFWAFTLPYMSYLFGSIVEQIKNHGIESVPIFKLVGIPLSLYVVIHVLRSIGYYAHGLFSLFSIPAFKANVVKKLFAHLGRQSVNYFEEKHAGSLTNKMTNTCISLEPILFNIFGTIFPQTLAIIITGIMLSMVVPYFGLILWVWGVGIIIYTYHSAKIGNQKATVFASACSTFNGHLVDVTSNIQTVIHQATIEQESVLLDKNMQWLVATERARNRHASKVMFHQHIAMNALVAFYLIGTVVGYEHGLVSMGEVVFVMTAVTAIAGLTGSLGKTFLELVYNVGLLNEGMSLFEHNPDVPEKDTATPHTIKEGDIKINEISFSYPGRPHIFDDFSLTIPSKQKIGIVGESGAGKTTLIKLLMRLYDTTSGSIEIDGIDISDYTKASLRTQIATVPQQLTLFHRSILDNIVYGCGEVDRSQVIAAAHKANCHDFIMTLEKQYDTLIGEQGVKLSGGQRQRIAIARAILKNAPILLFDEATSALDSQTEQAIQKALEVLLLDKTAIIIAHRLSTLKAMDKIIVIESGKIVETGTHNELIEMEGAYYHYWQQQSDGFIKH
jgi:ABC-type multidrug transport system fused ATPase/permease subunit